MHLRGTGESFAANIGGRMFGTPFAFVTQWLVGEWIRAGSRRQPRRSAYVAAGVAFTLFLVNLILSFSLPEQRVDEAIAGAMRRRTRSRRARTTRSSQTRNRNA